MSKNNVTELNYLLPLSDSADWEQREVGTAYSSAKIARYGSADEPIHDEEVFGLTEDNAQHKECTQFETTCNLLSVITGSGMLSLPYAAAIGGWITLPCLAVLCLIYMYTFHLLAVSIEKHYNNVKNQRFKTHILDYNIDYITFGKLAFGRYGDRIIMCIFGSELFLALMSFLMNIGINININIIAANLSVEKGIIIGAIVTAVLALTDLKVMAYSSVIGLILTLLTIVSIVLSGMNLATEGNESLLETRRYDMIDPPKIPISLGLIAFCFGGHGTL